MRMDVKRARKWVGRRPLTINIFYRMCIPPHRNGRLWTPLDQAADKGYADIIALLLEADAPLEAKDKSAVSAFIVRVAEYTESI